MIDIRIEDARPEVVIDPDLRAKLGIFSFDHDRYVEGLQLAGMPSEAIDTLQVQFQDNDWSKTYASYEYDTHVVTVKPSRTGLARVVQGMWNTLEPSASTMINYALAVEAKRAADAVLRREDVVGPARGPHSKPMNRMGGLVLAVGGGGVLGAQIGEILHAPSAAGALMGVMVGAAIDVTALLAWWDRRPEVKARTAVWDAQIKAREARAEAFAKSTDAFNIFNGLVDLQFLPSSTKS